MRQASHAATPNPIDDLALASLLSSRICHDLAGQIGALNNGVEIMTAGADADMRAHVLNLIEETGRRAAARLQFYRLAFGAGGSMSERTQLSEIETMTSNFLRGGRVSVDWQPEARELDRNHVRLMLNLIMLGVETLPRGGMLRVGVVDKSAVNLIVISEGRGATVEPQRAELLAEGVLGDGGEVQSRDAAFLHAHRLAGSLSAELTYGQEDDRVVYAATL